MTICFHRFLLFIILAVISFATHASSDTFNFIVLSDIHFDPYNDCVNKRPCPLIEKLRNNPAEKWPDLLRQYNIELPRFRENTNYRLLTSALSAAKNTAEKNQAKFVLVLGDSLAHGYRSKYKRFSTDKSAANYSSFARKTLEFLTRQLATAFPSIDVYNVVGNNDSYSGDYVIKPNSQFFNEAGNIWSRLIKNSANMQNQFSYAGYYSLTLQQPQNLRLIVMNTNLFSNKAKGNNLDSVASQELNWLHAELQKAKAANQVVLIAIHIPEGIDFYATRRTRLFRLFSLWKSQYIDRFQSELKQFAPQIKGIFAGHIHRNWFQVLDFDDGEIPVIGVTSVSPIFGNQPGFANISYFLQPIHLDSFSTYSFPLQGTAWIQHAGNYDKLMARINYKDYQHE